MVWLNSQWRSRWRWALFNLLALSILLFVLTQGSRDWQETDTFEPVLESGKWGIRFLLICLMMTPLHTYLRWSSALKLRKSAGLWTFGFGALHVVQYAIESWEPSPILRVNGTPWHWLAWPMQLYILLGLVGLAILTALAMTSNKGSMRWLGKKWKRLHRLVYVAGMALIVHALLASTMSKKMMIRDPNAVSELQAYFGLLVVLLIVRIPQVRTLLHQMAALSRPQTQVVDPIAPRVIPSRTPPQWPTLRAFNSLLVPDDIADPLVDRSLEEASKRPQIDTPQPHTPHRSTTKSKARVLTP